MHRLASSTGPITARKRWLHRALALGCLLLATPVVLVVGSIAAGMVWVAFSLAGLSSKDVPVAAPLSELHVFLEGGQPYAIHAVLAPGVRLDEVVDLSLFDGFEPFMSFADARRHVGLPSGTWQDPLCGVVTPYYAREKGCVSICRRPTEHGGHRWDVLAHPAPGLSAAVFRDERVLRQLRPWFPPDRSVSVTLRRRKGAPGYVEIRMRSNRCDWIELADRDS